MTRFTGGLAAAYVHDNGKPHWGPLRTSVMAARADRAILEAAQKASRLQKALERCHMGDTSEFDAGNTAGNKPSARAAMPAASMDDMFD